MRIAARRDLAACFTSPQSRWNSDGHNLHALEFAQVRHSLQMCSGNSIRTAHNPYAPDFLDLCDKLGFMVMNEMFDEWKQDKTPYGAAVAFRLPPRLPLMPLW